MRQTDAYIQNTLIIGAGQVGQLIAKKLLQHPEYGLRIVGFVDDNPAERRSDIGDLTIVGGMRHIGLYVELLDVERVIVAFSGDSHETTLETIRELETLDVQIDLVPRLFEGIPPESHFHSAEGLTLVALPRARLSATSMMLKRSLDLVGSLAGLVLLSPLLLAVGIAIKLDSRGPILFRQTRMGRNGGTFRIVKFRTMSIDADARKHEVAHLNKHRHPDGDPRMFKVPRRPAGHPGRAAPAAHEHRRAAAAVERARRRDEPRRPAPVDPRRARPCRRLGPEAARAEARDHGAVAGAGARRHPVQRDDRVRLPLRDGLVALERREADVPDDPGAAATEAGGMSAAPAIADPFPAASSDVFGVRCYAGTLDGAVESVIGRVMSRLGGYAVLCNVHVLMTAQEQQDVHRAVDDAWLVFPDGAPVAWLQRKLGAATAERVGGPDLMLGVLDRGRARGLRHVLVGSTDPTLQRLGERIRAQLRGVEIVGTLAPPFDDPSQWSDEAIDRIRGWRPDIVWLALGAPKQEMWMRQYAAAVAPRS